MESACAVHGHLFDKRLENLGPDDMVRCLDCHQYVRPVRVVDPIPVEEAQ